MPPPTGTGTPLRRRTPRTAARRGNTARCSARAPSRSAPSRTRIRTTSPGRACRAGCETPPAPPRRRWGCSGNAMAKISRNPARPNCSIKVLHSPASRVCEFLRYPAANPITGPSSRTIAPRLQTAAAEPRPLQPYPGRSMSYVRPVAGGPGGAWSTPCHQQADTPPRHHHEDAAGAGMPRYQLCRVRRCATLALCCSRRSPRCISSTPAWWRASSSPRPSPPSPSRSGRTDATSGSGSPSSASPQTSPPIVANGGLMPIERHTVVAAVGEERAAAYAPGTGSAAPRTSCSPPAQGHLRPLGDSVVVQIGGGGFVASPGDIVVWTGLVIFAVEVALAGRRASPSDESARRDPVPLRRRRRAAAPRSGDAPPRHQTERCDSEGKHAQALSSLW